MLSALNFKSPFLFFIIDKSGIEEWQILKEFKKEFSNWSKAFLNQNFTEKCKLLTEMLMDIF